MDESVSALEKALGITFVNKGRLMNALTHRSYHNERKDWPFPNNERLEYLGDAVLELAVSEFLYRKFSEWSEGRLTEIRAALVNYHSVAKAAEAIHLDRYILLSRGEHSGGEKGREAILADAMEAVLGAMYLDQGIHVCRRFLKRHLLPMLPQILASGAFKDAKSRFQELAQEQAKTTPVYRVVEENGPAHDRKFVMGVYLGNDLVVTGSGSSKQEAEQAAAAAALIRKPAQPAPSVVPQREKRRIVIRPQKAG